MKRMYTTLVTAILMASPIFANQLASTDCDGWKEGYPSYYCDCKVQTEGTNPNRLNEIPFDITVTDTIWYRSISNIFMEGFVANLYSDCNITMTIMDKCKTDSTKKMFRQIEVASNQSREVNIDDIKKMLEDFGIQVNNAALRIGIAPSAPGKTSRFICTPYGVGPNSTCEDCLPILPNKESLTSDSGYDVYVYDPSNTDEYTSLKMEWLEPEYYTYMYITLGTCDSDPVAEVDLVPGETTVYELPKQILDVARENNENLYFHFEYYTDEQVGLRHRLSVTSTKPSDPSNPTDIESVTTPTVDARLVLGTDGMIYILRGNQRYTLMGHKL